MGRSSLDIVNDCYAAWRAVDIPGFIALCDENVRVTQHIEDVALPFGGTGYGRASLAQRLVLIYADLCFVKADLEHVFVSDELLRINVDAAIQYMPSGAIFEGTLRHVWRVRNELVTEIDEYLDVARFKAFLRLLGQPARDAD